MAASSPSSPSPPCPPGPSAAGSTSGDYFSFTVSGSPPSSTRPGQTAISSAAEAEPESYTRPERSTGREHDCGAAAVAVPASPGPNDSPLLLTDSPTPGSPTATSTLTSTANAAASRPIAIELPAAAARNRTRPGVDGRGPIITPPAPLSARGDLPGAYFPLHEQQPTIRQTHPFQLAASQARQRSIELASRASSNSRDGAVAHNKEPYFSHRPGPSISITNRTAAPASGPSAATMPDHNSPQFQLSDSAPRRSDSAASTPVTSFNPSPYQENTLPMGKYYPSNYESRKAEKYRSRTFDSTTTSNLSPDNSASSSRQSPPMHARNASEAKRRLQQYQRDMIAQASIALEGNKSAAAFQSLRSIGFASMGKPNKPRLEPLGSPGPVTPMDLGGSDGGYLSVHGHADDVQAEEIARAIRADEEMRRREGAGSPAIELGGFSY